MRRFGSNASDKFPPPPTADQRTESGLPPPAWTQTPTGTTTRELQLEIRRFLLSELSLGYKIMRSNNRSLTSPLRWSRWRQFTDFVVRRRMRILLTVFLALFVDYWGGRILQLSLSDIHSPSAQLGLASVLAGCTLLAWAAGSKRNLFQPMANWQYVFFKDPCLIGLILSMLGFGLLLDNPKHLCVLIGPVILLDLVRLRREDSTDLHRRGSQWEMHPRDASWVVPVWLSNFAPLLIVPVVVLVVIAYAWPFDSLEFHETWEIRCLLLSCVGLAVRMLAAGQAVGSPYEGESPRSAPSLTTDGIFSIVRHPRYLGDYCIGLGVVLIPFVWWLPVAYSLAFYFYYQRIIAVDELQLSRKFDKRFEQWAAVTPALIPRLSQWRPASNPLSLRAALKGEYSALLLVIVLHSSVEWLEHLILDRRVMLEMFWIILALAGLIAYVLIRYLVKHTSVLNVQA